MVELRYGPCLVARAEVIEMPRHGLNKVILIGAVASEPSVRTTPSGRCKLWFRLHTVESVADEAGIPRERHAWHSVVMWGPRAEGLGAFLEQGRRVAIEGRLSTYKREGATPARWETEIVARDLLLLDHAPREVVDPARDEAA